MSPNSNVLHLINYNYLFYYKLYCHRGSNVYNLKWEKWIKEKTYLEYLLRTEQKQDDI